MKSGNDPECVKIKYGEKDEKRIVEKFQQMSLFHSNIFSVLQMSLQVCFLSCFFGEGRMFIIF